MSEQATQEQVAISEFERFVNESQQIDNAYAAGTLGEWIEEKIKRELGNLERLSRNNERPSQ